MDRRLFLVAGGAATFLGGSATAGPRLTADIRALVVRQDRRRILQAADHFLRDSPQTITSFRAPRGRSGPHDYYSEADYWWPDPANPTRPYVRRDGYSNPAKFVAHRDAIIRLSLQMPALTAAWRLTGKPQYAEHAVGHLKAWFVDPETRMNPELSHAQAIIGVNDGRAIGIIDTLHLVEVARAVEALPPSPVKEATTAWFARYLTWLTTSGNGQEERDQANNHGSAWLLQAAAFASLTSDGATSTALRKRFRTVLIPTQIAPDGRQLLELARTKPYGYSLFNLDVLATAAHLLSTDEDNLWRYRTADGRGLAVALDYMLPFIANKSRWPHARDVENFDDWPVRQVALLFGGAALKRQDCLDLWTRLQPDPTVGEIVRNFPIRQPLLWV